MVTICKIPDAMSDDTNRTGQMRRRRFLSLTAVGASAWGLTGAVGAQSDRTTQIPLARSGSEVVETAEVPESWYDGLQQARQARDAVADQMPAQAGGESGTSGVGPAAGDAEAIPPQESGSTVGIEPGDGWEGDMRDFRVQVRAGDGRVRDESPAEANGMDVRTEEVDRIVDYSCPNRGYHDPLPGGIAVYSDTEDDGQLVPGSLTTAVTKEGIAPTYMMTAAHVFWSTDCYLSYGEDAFIAEDTDNKIGGVTDWSIVKDYALIANSTSEVDFANQVYEETDSGSQVLDVDGHLTEAGVAYWMAKDKEVYTSGQTTGLTAGQLTEMYVEGDACNDQDGHGVTTDAKAGGGDSGAPVYAKINGDAHIISMIQQGNPNNFSPCGTFVGNETWGTSAYHLHDEDDIVFDV